MIMYPQSQAGRESRIVYLVTTYQSIAGLRVSLDVMNVIRGRIFSECKQPLIVQLYGNWYFMDVTWEDPYDDEWRWFLQGTGENNDSHFLRYHGVAIDMIYPEVSVTDFHN